MNFDKVDTLVSTTAILLLVTLIGMIFDIWYLVFFPMPVLITVLLALGSLNKEDQFGPVLKWLIGFGAISSALFVWAGTGMFSQEPRFGGLTVAAGVILYVMWPLFALVSGPLYAYVYKVWLSRDVREITPPTDEVGSQDSL